MARRSSVRYWSSRNAYCCWFAGKQHVLAEGPDDYPTGPTYQTATQKFAELSAINGVDGAKDNNTCRVVCEMYLRWISTRRKFQTMKLRKKVYVFFTDVLGEVPVKDLTHHVVYKWLDQMREWRQHPGTGKPTRWTDGSVRNACTSLQVAFNWAARSGIRLPSTQSWNDISRHGFQYCRDRLEKRFCLLTGLLVQANTQVANQEAQ